MKNPYNQLTIIKNIALRKKINITNFKVNKVMGKIYIFLKKNFMFTNKPLFLHDFEEDKSILEEEAIP